MLGHKPEIDPILHEELLRDAFEIKYVDTGALQVFPAIFKPDLLHDQHKRAVLALIQAGYSMGGLEAAYISLASQENPRLSVQSVLRSRNADHIRCFSSVLQCLLGMPEHKDVVMGYLRNDLAWWRRLSFGLLGGRGMHSVVGGDPTKHRASCVFSSLLNDGPGQPVANLCRDHDGCVWDPLVFDQLLILESDAHGFLMSAIANRDREGIEGLLSSGLYLRFISREHTLMRVGDKIKAHPEWDLEESLGPLLAVRNHETVMTEFKRMIDSRGATVHQFMSMFWSEISPLAISHLVSYTIKSKMHVDSASNFLQACVQSGFDLYLGILEAGNGFGAALDALGKDLGQVEKTVSVLESYLWFMAGGASKTQLAPLLTYIPAEMLASHAKAADLLMERYKLTGEKTLLALGDRNLRGRALENDIGL